MKFLLLWAALLMGTSSVCAQMKVIQTDAVQSQLSQTLSFLSSDQLAGRAAGTDGNLAAAAYLESLLIQAQIAPYFHSYRDTLSNFKKLTYNIVGRIEGQDPLLKDEFILLGAHYDHIGIRPLVNGDSIANGANDNASGTAVVSEIARYFARNKTNKRSIVIAFFTAEENGLLGAYHLADKMKQQGQSLYLMLNFEMLGVPMNREYLAYLTGYNDSNLADKINAYSGKKLVGNLKFAEQKQLFKHSDNYPFFLKYKIAAQTFSSFDFENFNFYHHVKDEFDQMDIAHLQYFTNEIIPVVEQLSNAPTQEVKIYN